MTDGGVDFRARRKCAKCGCFHRARLEVRGRARKVGVPRARVPCARKTVISQTDINCCLLNYYCEITRLKCQLSGDILHLCECDCTVYVILPAYKCQLSGDALQCSGSRLNIIKPHQSLSLLIQIPYPLHMF